MEQIKINLVVLNANQEHFRIKLLKNAKYVLMEHTLEKDLLSVQNAHQDNILILQNRDVLIVLQDFTPILIHKIVSLVQQKLTRFRLHKYAQNAQLGK